MIRAFLVVAAALPLLLPAGIAHAQVKAPVAAKSTNGRCDNNKPVCGTMGPDNRVPFQNACQAEEAGASNIVTGPCTDED